MIREQLAADLSRAMRALGIDVPRESVHLECPARREHGDWSSNVAMANAKNTGRKPRELAQAIADQLNADPPLHVVGVEVAGPGFVNFRLADTWLHDVLREVAIDGEAAFACPNLGQGRRVNVEFVSANPTGPLHAGGGRWAAYGDALVNLLNRCGYRADREYYLNDRGVQMQKFAESLAALAHGDPLPEDGYRGEYLKGWAAEMPAGADPFEWGYARVRRHLEETLAAIGVHYDTWFSERSMIDSGAIDATLADLRARGVAYDSEGAVWLRSTDYGDDKDRVLVKSDGEPTYLLPDIAYHRDKFARGYELLIDIWGADHHGYVDRLKAGAQALGHRADELEIIIGQLVVLKRGSEEVRLSKRTGDIIELADIVDEVGADAARLTFLLQSLDTRQTVDLEVVVSQANENPVFYVQYANARIYSLLRFAAEKGVQRAPLEQVDLALLTHPRELDLLRVLAGLPDAMRIACVERAPHKITNWVRELAAAFHGFYHDCKVVHPDVPADLTQARLWLVESARIGISIGLGVLGVHAPESM